MWEHFSNCWKNINVDNYFLKVKILEANQIKIDKICRDIGFTLRKILNGEKVKKHAKNMTRHQKLKI